VYRKRLSTRIIGSSCSTSFVPLFEIVCDPYRVMAMMCLQLRQSLLRKRIINKSVDESALV
jgi:hypothetical protein